MFLAGKKNTILKNKMIDNLDCPSCSTKGSTEIAIVGTYKHLFQIPFLSGGKSGIASCKKCLTSYELNTMPSLVKLAYYELKETTKTPVWFYIGLIVIKTLVLIKIFSKYI